MLAVGVEDWNAAAVAADTHGVLPLLNRWLASARPGAVPAALAETIRLRAQSIAIAGLKLSAELLALTRILESSSIPVLALKGPALAVRAYGNLALRPQSDLDLLVHARDVDRALVVLTAAGHSRLQPLSPGQEATFRDVEYHIALTAPSGTSVELHWGIIKRQFALDVAENFWWSNATDAPLGGAPVHTLSNEATLIYLAIHGGKHEWPHLRWIGDIAAVSRLAPFDWPLVARMDKQLGTSRMTRLALSLAGDLLHAALPDAAREYARADLAIPPMVSEIRARLEVGSPPGFASSTNFQLALRPRLSDKISFAVHQAITPNLDDLSFASLPVPLRSLYLLLRPIRLARKWLS